MAISLVPENSSITVVIAFICLAFLGKDFGSLDWTVMSDTVMKKILGVASGIFNGLGNLTGLVATIIIGYIVY